MYNIVTIVNNTVYVNIANRIDLISSHHKKKIIVMMWADRY